MVKKRDSKFYNFQNKIMEKLERTHLSPNESKYCWVLFRETCGYGDYKVKITRSRISDLTGILEVNISRTERKLKKRNIIVVNSKNKGFNPNIIEWEKVSVSIPFEKVSVPIQKGIDKADKKGITNDTLITKKKIRSSKKENFYKKLSSQEIDKLEGDPWYKAIMYNQGKFSISYIEGTMDKYIFNTRMSCWYKYTGARNVISKEPYFSKLLDDFCEER